MRAWDTMTAHSAGRDMERAGAGIPIGKGGDDSWKTTMMRLPCKGSPFGGSWVLVVWMVEVVFLRNGVVCFLCIGRVVF